MDGIDLAEFQAEGSLTERYESCIALLTGFLDRYHPVKTFSAKVDDPFFTNEVKLLIARRKWCLNKSRRARVGVLNLRARESRRLMKQIKVILIKNKKDILSSNLLKHKNDPKRFWKVINDVWKGEASHVTMCLVNEVGVEITQFHHGSCE